MGDLRLLLPAVGTWVTAWCAVAASDAGLDPVLVAGSIWAAAAALLAMVFVGRWRQPITPVAAIGLVVLAAAGLTASSAAAQLDRRADSPLTAIAAAHTSANVVIEVVAAPRPMRAMWAQAGRAPSLRVDAQVVAVDGRAVTPVPVTTTLDLPARELSLGVRIAMTARVAVLPGAEQSAFRLRPEGEAVIQGAPPAWLAWAVVPRADLADAATRLDGDGAALVPGLAIGDTTSVGAELDEAMRASSLSHLTAVSGANCAVVTAAAFGLAALCGASRSVRVLAALFALAGFIVLVTPQPSVVRAGAMAVAVLVAIASGRPGGGVAALSVAVIGLLAFDPWLARDYGFALSAAATAGLILLAGPLAARLARVMPVPLAVGLAVPLAAQLACQPILVLLDPAIALYGVPANLLAAPAAPIGTVVGLIACLVLPVLPAVGTALVQVAWFPATWIALVAHGTSSLPGGRLSWLPDAPGAVLLAACTALALVVVFAARRRTRAWAGAVLAVGLAVPVGISVGGPLVVGATRPGDWDLAACDVGQGDAMLVRVEEATALIDTGPDPAALDRCLAVLGVGRIDLLVITHWDADHAGGARAVVGRVDTVLHGPLDGDRSDRVIGPLGDAGAESVEVVAGDRGTLGDASWRIAWPRPGAAPGNDASVVLDLEASGYRAVFLGDLGEEAQAGLLRSTELGRADVVKVAHHGSADQSDRIYEELAATVGLIGVGADNGYGHPTAQVLELLAASRTTVVRTDRSGTCTLTADGDGGFGLWCERGDVGARS
ncbi:ComEC/Rec2 family competence protein [Agromyces sp. NPDC004153]